MRSFLILIVFATGAAAQQCSQGNAALFQDDKFVSGTCTPSLFSGDIYSVKETQGYNVSCVATDGSSLAGQQYFSASLVLSGTGQIFCGDMFTSPFNCDPVFTMSTTQATTPSDFNTFTFQEFDRVRNGNHCDQPNGFQQLFRQCQGQPCDAAGGGGGCDQFLGNGSSDFTDNGGPAPEQTCGDTSPIIIDLSGKGFYLTSALNGVLFDIAATGHPLQIGWIAPGAANAFLVLDRDGNGLISSGKELFGTVTPQSASTHPNGFLALAEYDKPENGGNSDGILDARDGIWPQLRLWIDANHDGVSQPEELHRLDETGVFNISLEYQELRKRDQFGNLLRFRARVNQGLNKEEDPVGRSAYDVFFVTK